MVGRRESPRYGPITKPFLRRHRAQTAIIAAYNFCNRRFDSFLPAAAAAGFENVALGYYAGADPHERLGDGDVGYAQLLPRLQELGYEGPHTLERALGENDDEIEVSMRAAYAFVTAYLH